MNQLRLRKNCSTMRNAQCINTHSQHQKTILTVTACDIYYQVEMAFLSEMKDCADPEILSFVRALINKCFFPWSFLPFALLFLLLSLFDAVSDDLCPFSCRSRWRLRCLLSSFCGFGALGLFAPRPLKIVYLPHVET